MSSWPTHPLTDLSKQHPGHWTGCQDLVGSHSLSPPITGFANLHLVVILFVGTDLLSLIQLPFQCMWHSIRRRLLLRSACKWSCKQQSSGEDVLEGSDFLLPCPRWLGYHALLLFKPPILKPQTSDARKTSPPRTRYRDEVAIIPDWYFPQNPEPRCCVGSREGTLAPTNWFACHAATTARGEVVFGPRAAHCSDRELPVTRTIMYHFVT